MELWVPVQGYERYEVSSHGLLYNTNYNRLVHGSVDSNGYRIVGMTSDVGRKYWIALHRLVALHFVDGYDDGLTVNHIDGNKLNNTADNLEWVTRGENIEHAFRTGLNTKHKRNMVRYKDFMIVETGEIFKTQVACAAALGVSHVMVGKALKSQGRWAVRGYHLEYIH